MAKVSKCFKILFASACVLSCLEVCFGKTYLLNNVPRSWETSKEYCEDRGMELVTISSSMEYNRLVEFLNHNRDNSTHIWLALRLPENSTRVEDFEWTDGTKLTWSYWDTAESEPNHLDYAKCVALRTKDRMTYDTKPCNYRYYPMCQRKAWTMFEKVQDLDLGSDPLFISPLRSWTECSRLCHSTGECTVFVVVQGTCSLYDVDTAQYMQCTNPGCNTYRV